MKEYKYTEEQVHEMWKRSYAEQIGIAQSKCMEAIVKTDGKVSVAFSGGKDSAVVLYIMAKMWAMTAYKDRPLPVVFSNTSNEFSCMTKYVKEYCSFIEETFNIEVDLQIVHGPLGYVQVVDQVGLPFISKKVARMVKDIKRAFKEAGVTMKEVEPLLPKKRALNAKEERLESAQKLREIGLPSTVILYLTGVTSQDHYTTTRLFPFQYCPLIDTDFELSEECCFYLKKNPVGQTNSKEDLLPVTGEMACDSKERMDSYRMTGCNMFVGSRAKSKPLGAATEQTVLHFIYDEKLPIAPIYGILLYNSNTGIYAFTGEQRTGCKLCGFGIKFDPTRFIRLQKLEPEMIRFAFTSRDKGGLGYNELCNFLNEHCGMNIAIPTIAEGYYEQRAKAYAEKKAAEKEKEKIVAS